MEVTETILKKYSDRDVSFHLASIDLMEFVHQTKSDYTEKWFHRKLAEKLEALESGEIKRLIVTVPPQHGKSQLVSRHFPAWSLGTNPDSKIVVSSYSASLANSFNTDCQIIMESQEYQKIFPNTKLRRTATVKTSDPQNVNIFKVVGRSGYFKSVGVGGSLTGTTIDIGIIDDPIKDAREASSLTIRQRIWEWFTHVFQTRLHNDSRVLITMTRWHEDDLVGRLMTQMEKDPESEKWEVINFEALREDMSDPDDPRKKGEALFPEKHSRETLETIRKSTPSVFSPMYMGKPTPEEGNIFKSKWFEIVSHMRMIEEATSTGVEIIPDFFVDSAFTEKTKNDPTSIMVASKVGNLAFITACFRVWKNFPDLIKYIIEIANSNGYQRRSKIYIEPKASGQSIAQQLRKSTKLNVIDDLSDFLNLKDSKEVRANSVTVHCESMRVKLIQGHWNQSLIDELKNFPNAKNDDQVDVTVMMCSKYFSSPGGGMSWMST